MTQLDPRPALHGRGSAVLVGIVVGGSSWLVMALGLGGIRIRVAAILVCGGTGVALMAVSRQGLPLAYAVGACLAAGAGLSFVLAGALTPTLLVAYAVVPIGQPDTPTSMMVGAAAFVGAPPARV